MNSNTNIDAPSLRLLRELPSPMALFDDGGGLVEGNAAFLAMAEIDVGKSPSFRELFGEAPQRIADDPSCVLAVADRHFAASVRHVVDWGWLCQFQDVTPLIHAQVAAQQEATIDGLTGLANRAAIRSQVDRLPDATPDAAALLMIDLDRFKAVNDTLGHPVGDRLLCKVADRLRASVRATDRVARLGGDEFAVLQTGADQPEAAETLAKRLVEVLGRPYIVDGHMIDVGASVGVAMPSHQSAGEELFKQADIALYRAKHGGRGRYSFFEPHMDEEMQERRALELDLRRALAFRQFELHYQPQMEVATRVVTGMEALLRWQHPTRGLVSPGEFIPLAEQTGLIVPIGEWVIRQACEDAATWPAGITVAVNVSAKQLASGKLVGAVESALARSGLPASRLEVEITESVLMSDVVECVATLHRLRDLGTRVSMDDFGTGYSSLSYLSSFPFDTIKIDQSFVRQGDAVKNQGIVRAITAVAEHLGMTTIAEGVETEGQLGDVTTSGCGSIQGYLISRPVPAQHVANLLEELTPGSAPSASVGIPAAQREDGLYRLVYYSRNAIFGLHAEVTDAVEEVLAASQRNNAAAGVTGALMFTDGYFAQVLEGKREAVEHVFERIQLDDRHTEVQLLSFAPVDNRVFGNWSMAFVGNDELGRQKFGHYAALSGFDFAASDSDGMIAHLRTLLLAEEGSSLKQAA